MLFALPMLIYLLSGPVFYGYDGEMMYRVSESLVLRHSIQVLDPIYHYAQPYAPYGIGTSLMLVPLVAIGQLLLHDPRALVILYLPAMTALTVVSLYAILVETGVSRRWAAVVAVVYAFGTLAWHYSGVLFSEPLVALMMMVAFLGLLRFKRIGQARWLVVAGAASGMAVLARDDSVFLVLPPIVTYGAVLIFRGGSSWPARLEKAAAYLVPVTAAGVIALGYHLVRFGTGSGPYANDGIGFVQPLLSGLYGLLLSPGDGLFVFEPVLLVALIGFIAFARRWRTEAMVIAGLVVLRLLFFARWWDWSGGATWGPRYIVPLIPLLMIPVAFAAGARWRWITAALGAVGVGIQILGQLVPYGLYYGSLVPTLAAHLGVCQCVPAPGQGSRAIHNVMAFDWHYAPLTGQMTDLLHGVIAPAWAPIAPAAVPLAVIAAVAIGLRIRLLASRLAELDEGGIPSAGRPADGSVRVA